MSAIRHFVQHSMPNSIHKTISERANNATKQSMTMSKSESFIRGGSESTSYEHSKSFGGPQTRSGSKEDASVTERRLPNPPESTEQMHQQHEKMASTAENGTTHGNRKRCVESSKISDASLNPSHKRKRRDDNPFNISDGLLEDDEVLKKRRKIGSTSILETHATTSGRLHGILSQSLEESNGHGESDGSTDQNDEMDFEYTSTDDSDAKNDDDPFSGQGCEEVHSKIGEEHVPASNKTHRVKTPDIERHSEQIRSSSEAPCSNTTAPSAEETEEPAGEHSTNSTPSTVAENAQNVQVHPAEHVEDLQPGNADVTTLTSVVYEGRDRLALLVPQELQDLICDCLEAKGRCGSISKTLDQHALVHTNLFNAARAVFYRESERLDTIKKTFEDSEAGGDVETTNELYSTQCAYNRAARNKEEMEEQYNAFQDTDEQYILLKKEKELAEAQYHNARAAFMNSIEDACAIGGAPEAEQGEETNSTDPEVLEEDESQALDAAVPEEHDFCPEQECDGQPKTLDSVAEEDVMEKTLESPYNEDDQTEIAAKLEAAEWLLKMQRERLQEAKTQFYDYRENQYREVRRQFALDNEQSLHDPGLNAKFGPVFLSKCMELTKKIIDEEQLVKTYKEGFLILGGVDEDQESNFGDQEYGYDDETEQAEMMKIDISYILEWISEVTTDPIETSTRQDGEAGDRTNVPSSGETVHICQDAKDHESDRHSQPANISRSPLEKDLTSAVKTLQRTGQVNNKVHGVERSEDVPNLGPRNAGNEDTFKKQQVASATVTPQPKTRKEEVPYKFARRLEEGISDCSSQCSSKTEDSVTIKKIPTVDIAGKETRKRKAGTKECGNEEDFYPEKKRKRLKAWAQAVRMGYA